MSNPILERAKAHFADKEVQVVEVPEWGDDDGPALIHVKPFTVQEKDRLTKGNKADGEILVDAIIMKAADANGQKLFTVEDKQSLKRSVDAAVLARIGTEILKELFEAQNLDIALGN